ncbi:efflux RND transporter periplasmic adaptor subunit [Azohydromonas caseinilytica]|uniref:Efflux RND transporter periplasmic adaptor subunit n=1 Tax=Azohydromonas caseinilytica TaxID=2728836 RepID=A0A848FDG4_9BURK|nr:efflux RND transporter periplasmic adaptor subunit [Azohydromonas caseinilytica]NML16845.1 efflux RND transporter periplasmic adaptor subunit [Azohydromonas caseinilytica]
MLRPPHRLTLTTTLLALACSAVMLVGCSKGEQPAAAPAAPPPAQVGVLTVQAQPLTLRTELAGRTSPYLVAEVRPQVGGLIQKRLFEEGSFVKAGQTLYQIDPSTLQAELESARASLAKAQANVATAELRARRYDELVTIDAVSKQARDDAQAQLLQARADVATAAAAVKTAQIRVDYARVSAPIAGIAGRSSVTPGALVTASQAAPLVTVQQLDPIYVDIQRASAELLQLQRDFASGRLQRVDAGRARVKLQLEDGSDYPVEGTLKFAEATVDASTGNVTLRAVFPNPKGTLLPGMYVRALLEEGSTSQAILVPQRAVTRDPKGNALAMVVGDDNKVQPRPLKVDRNVGDQWLVTEGLKPGDKLIVDGLQKVRPGAPVTPVALSASAPAAGVPGAPAGPSAAASAPPAPAAAAPAASSASGVTAATAN